MRKRILALAFVVALLVAMALPLFGGATAEAVVHPAVPICNAPAHSEAGGKPGDVGEIKDFPPSPIDPAEVAQGAERSGLCTSSTSGS